MMLGLVSRIATILSLNVTPRDTDSGPGFYRARDLVAPTEAKRNIRNTR